MQEVLDRLRRVEDRLERLLASGWRNAGGEAKELAAEAEVLAGLGLAELAERLRRVAGAESAADALQAIALASAACRLLRARLPVDVVPSGDWKPLAAPANRRAPSHDRLIPVSRMALGGGEVWASVRLRGAAAAELVLLDPCPPPAAPAEAPPSFVGMVGKLLHSRSEPPGEAAPHNGPHIWLHREIQGYLRWRGRYPLGAAGEVQHCALAEPDWPPPPEPEADPVAPFRHALAGDKLEDGLPVLRAGGPLRVKGLDPADVGSYVWPDPAVAAAFQSAARGPVWALVWAEKIKDTKAEIVVPLALVVPGGLLHRPQLIHLVPGCPTDTLPG